MKELKKTFSTNSLRSSSSRVALNGGGVENSLLGAVAEPGFLGDHFELFIVDVYH